MLRRVCRPLCVLTAYTAVGMAPAAASATGMQAVGLDVPQVLCS